MRTFIFGHGIGKPGLPFYHISSKTSRPRIKAAAVGTDTLCFSHYAFLIIQNSIPEFPWLIPIILSKSTHYCQWNTYSYITLENNLVYISRDLKLILTLRGLLFPKNFPKRGLLAPLDPLIDPSLLTDTQCRGKLLDERLSRRATLYSSICRSFPEFLHPDSLEMSPFAAAGAPRSKASQL